MLMYFYDCVTLEMVLLKEKCTSIPGNLSLQYVSWSDRKPRLMMVPDFNKQLAGELIYSQPFTFVECLFHFSTNMHEYV